MNWISNYVRPKINSLFTRREVPENLWVKCDECGTMLFHRELAEALNVCTNCGHHMPISPRDRFRTLFDGGIIDYHFDFRFRRRPGLVLFPHFFDRITPGWFDKPLRWRRPRLEDLDDVLMIAPSDAFVSALPGGRVPDRNDFLRLGTAERIRRWKDVVDRCRVLADELHELIETQRLAEAVLPFEA